MHVPVALVDGDHLGADVAADDPGRGGERLAEVRARRRRSPLLSVASMAGWMSAVACRVARTAVPIGLWSWSQSVCSERRRCRRVGVVRRRRRDRGVVQRADGHQRHRARRSRSGGTPFTRPTPWSGEPVGASRPAGSASRPGRSSPGAASSTSSIAEKCERLAVVSPVAWIGGQLARRSTCGSSGASFGCSPKRPSVVPAEQLVLRDGDGGPGRVVAGVAVRHHQRQAVGAAAQRQHHEHRRRGRRRRGGGRHGGGADHERRTAEREGAAQHAAPAHRGELGAAGVVRQGSGHRVHRSWGHRRRKSGESKKVVSRRGNIHCITGVVLVDLLVRVRRHGLAAGLLQRVARVPLQDPLRHVVDEVVEPGRWPSAATTSARGSGCPCSATSRRTSCSGCSSSPSPATARPRRRRRSAGRWGPATTSASSPCARPARCSWWAARSLVGRLGHVDAHQPVRRDQVVLGVADLGADRVPELRGRHQRASAPA